MGVFCCVHVWSIVRGEATREVDHGQIQQAEKQCRRRRRLEEDEAGRHHRHAAGRCRAWQQEEDQVEREEARRWPQGRDAQDRGARNRAQGRHPQG